MFLIGKCLIFIWFATSSLAIHLTYPSSRTTTNYYIIFEAEDITGNVEFLDKLGQKVSLNFGLENAHTDDKQSDFNKLAIGFLPKIAGFDWPTEKEWFLILEAFDHKYEGKYIFIGYSKFIANFTEELNPREDVWEYTNSTRIWQMEYGFECYEATINMASDHMNPLFAAITFKNLKIVPFANQESAEFKPDQNFNNCFYWYMPYLNFIQKYWWIFAIIFSICFCCCCECCRELAKSIWECFGNLLKFLGNLLQAFVILLFSCLCCLCCLIYHVRQRRQEERQNREEQIRQRLEAIHRLRRLQQEAEGQAAREQIARELFPLLLLHSMMNEREENEDEEAAGTSNQSNIRRQQQSASSAESATTATNPIAFKECSICEDNERSIVFEPCMHLVACEICSERIKGQGSKCPICRRQIQKMSRVFLP